MAEELRSKLITLASRIDSQQITALNAVLLELRAQRLELANRQKVKTLLAESLTKSASAVDTALASYSDSDRILDDIVNILNDED